MSLTGFAAFNKSKVAKKVMQDSSGKGMVAGNNSSKSFTRKSGKNITGPADESGSKGPYGSPQLNGAQGNISSRKMC